MKRLVLIVMCVMLGAGALSAQRLVAVGRYITPTMNVKWLSDSPALGGKALLLEFFHSANSDCRSRVEEVNDLAYTYNNILDVVVVAREPVEQVASILLHDYQNAYVGIDEQGALFGQMEVPHVPYAILLSPRGEVLWLGNPTKLTTATLDKLLK